MRCDLCWATFETTRYWLRCRLDDLLLDVRRFLVRHHRRTGRWFS